jgi:hypothetical protein
MFGGTPKISGRCDFHDSPEVHHRNNVGNLADYRKVVRNEQQTGVNFVREVYQEVSELCLGGGVEA